MTVRLEDVRGLWKRRYIRSAAGTDETTEVYWMQAERLFADIRIPAAAGSSAADGPALCDGFAGTSEVEDGVCTWTRELNYRGRVTGLDVGRLRFEDGALFEDGVHADYVERWERVGEADAPLPKAARLSGAGGRRGILVWTPTHFLYAHGATDPRLRTETLEALLRELTDRAALLHSGDHGFGERRDGQWRVTLATDPARVGALYREGGEPTAGEAFAAYAASPEPVPWRVDPT